MREKAKRELIKKTGPPDIPVEKKEKNIPSLFSGFWLSFLGIFTIIFFISFDQVLLAIFAGVPFLYLGIKRTTGASFRRAKTGV